MKTLDDGTLLICAAGTDSCFERKVQGAPIGEYTPYRPRSIGSRSASDLPVNENMYDPREPLANAQDRANSLKAEIHKLMASQPHLRFQQAWDQLRREKPQLFDDESVVTHPD
jgi:hypothetical protein